MYASRYNDGTLLSVWVQPRASKTAVVGFYGGSIKLSVKSPPVDDRANEECVRYLSSILALPKRQIEIKSGQQSRRKGILIKGMAPEKVMEALQDAVG